MNKYIDEKPAECPICIESFVGKDNALECGHWIHINCVVKSGKPICPICRVELVELSLLDKNKIINNNLKYNEEANFERILFDRIEALRLSRIDMNFEKSIIDEMINRIEKLQMSRRETTVDKSLLLNNILDKIEALNFEDIINSTSHNNIFDFSNIIVPNNTENNDNSLGNEIKSIDVSKIEVPNRINNVSIKKNKKISKVKKILKFIFRKN